MEHRAISNYIEKMKYRSYMEVSYDICRLAADAEEPLTYFDISRLSASNPRKIKKAIQMLKDKGLITTEFDRVIVTERGTRWMCGFRRVLDFCWR
jgi:predicted transcriptional regulator